MKSLDNIIEEWRQDSIIDVTDPSREILRIPTLHSKYLGYMSKHKLSAKKAQSDYLAMKRKKWEYYTGKMSKEDLELNGWEQFQFVLKTDIAIYLESDTDLTTITNRKAYHEEAASICESIIKELTQRTWQLREHMTHERFINGSR